jgi:hypothetical protein
METKANNHRNFATDLQPTTKEPVRKKGKLNAP